MQQETHDIVIEALKGTPAVAGALASIMTPPTPNTADEAHHADNQRRFIALESYQ